MKERKVVLDAEGIDRSLTRIAYEILEKNKGVKDLVLVGIRTGGVFLAKRLCEKISMIEEVNVSVGILDITLYRDDLLTTNKKPSWEKQTSHFHWTIKKSFSSMMSSSPEGPYGQRWMH